MAKVESNTRSNINSVNSTQCLNIDYMRSLVKQYSELGQWSSALFWADAAAAVAAGSGPASGDDIWLLASAMMMKGEWHRASYAITSRGLHRRHLLCLGVAMRAHLLAKEPAVALSVLEECDSVLLDTRNSDQTHNRAVAGVLLLRARALSALERREAAAEALCSALRADCACFEAFELLLEQHALTPRQENELLDTLPISSQLGAAEGALLRGAYRERLLRHSPAPPSPAPADARADCPLVSQAEAVRSRTLEGRALSARRLAAGCGWRGALAALAALDPWACPDVRAACLVEMRRPTDLFTHAHTLVDKYPHTWIAWFAVGCYYYLIGKNEFARRYLSKAKSLEPGAGCVWLAYGHSFAAENEHDQAMAAYFKATQLMSGCHLPPLYVAVECSLLNNVAMCERFFMRAAVLHENIEILKEKHCRHDTVRFVDSFSAYVDPLAELPLELSEMLRGVDEELAASGAAPATTWDTLVRTVRSPRLAHEAGAAAYRAGDVRAAAALWGRALGAARAAGPLGARWAAALDALGHACRRLRRPHAALRWHERALALRPQHAPTHAARGLCLALLGRARAAAAALHAALARDPDDAVAVALLDAVLDTPHDRLDDEEIPQMAFPRVNICLPAEGADTGAGAPHDATNTSDMSMSFD